MKYSLLIAFLFSTSVFGFNRFSYFNHVSEEFCADKKIDYKNDILYCVGDNAQTVIDARVGGTVADADMKNLGFFLWNAVDAGIVPDADSSTAYFYKRWLLDAKGNRVGVVSIEGWYNTEMESSARFDVRYNLKGQVVKAESKPMRRN